MEKTKGKRRTILKLEINNNKTAETNTEIMYEFF